MAGGAIAGASGGGPTLAAVDADSGAGAEDALELELIDLGLDDGAGAAEDRGLGVVEETGGAAGGRREVLDEEAEEEEAREEEEEVSAEAEAGGGLGAQEEEDEGLEGSGGLRAGRAGAADVDADGWGGLPAILDDRGTFGGATTTGRGGAAAAAGARVAEAGGGGGGPGLASVGARSPTDGRGGDVTCRSGVKSGTCWMSCSAGAGARADAGVGPATASSSSSHSSSMSGRLSSVLDRGSVGAAGRSGGGTRPDDRRAARDERDWERATTGSSACWLSERDDDEEAIDEREDVDEDEAKGWLAGRVRMVVGVSATALGSSGCQG